MRENEGKGNWISNSRGHKLNQAQMCNKAQAQKTHQANLISWYDLTSFDATGRKAPLKHMERIPK